jgi:ABC-2 type transport system ATP-binding protein
VSFQVERGSIFALLGPNGAGKSTTINMLTTLLIPDAGHIHIAGLNVVTEADAVRRIIGATFQDIVLDRDLTGAEVLDFTGRLYGISAPVRTKRIKELLDMVELNEAAHRLTGTYSGGMRRRLELARCLMTEPQVLFLDEPTQGLDPLHRVMIWQYIQHLQAEQQMTVVLTTHAMEEAEELADMVGIIDHGQLVAHGTPTLLMQATGSERIVITTANEGTQLHESWHSIAWVQRCDVVGADIHIGVDRGAQRIAEVLQRLEADGIQVREVRMVRPSLADVFLQVTGRLYRDEVR